MHSEPQFWRNRSPGNLDLLLDEVYRSPVGPNVEGAVHAAKDWARMPLAERAALLCRARQTLELEREDLALGITVETGKPLEEARSEVTALLVSFQEIGADAECLLTSESVANGAHTGWIRRRPRGVAAVITPYTDPLALGHSAILTHLLTGNTVILKPSPLAAGIAATYFKRVASVLPSGVLSLVQGAAQTSLELCTHPQVRSVCFSGSAGAGRHLSQLLAGDLGKELTLHLGGKNTALICADADIPRAAKAVAEGICLTAGQRCSATSRVLVDERIVTPFLEQLRKSLSSFQPSDPTDEVCRLGPLIGPRAIERYNRAISPAEGGDWILPGSALESVGGLRGHFVQPALFHYRRRTQNEAPPLLHEEVMAPVAVVQSFSTLDEAIVSTNATAFGLTCSIFTRSEAQFWRLADEVQTGNIYANMATTSAPGSLPHCAWGDSGNRRPSGRGFFRFTSAEQSVQIARQSLEPT